MDNNDDIHVGGGESAADVLLGQSILDRAKARRAGRDLDHEWFDIPSWDGELKGRYKVLERDDVERMVRSVKMRNVSNGKGNQAGQSNRGAGAESDLDFIVKACVNLKVHDNETEEEKELCISYSDIDSIKELFDDPDHAELHSAVESIRSPREAVAFLMGYNGIAIASHAAKLARWMQDTSKESDPQ